jgi:hypothetical protein
VRLLVVEDEPRIAELLRVALGRAGFVADTVASCADARATLPLNPYDILMTRPFSIWGFRTATAWRHLGRRGAPETRFPSWCSRRATLYDRYSREASLNGRYTGLLNR